jgi:flagellar biosynthesis chaperone FliJ
LAETLRLAPRLPPWRTTMRREVLATLARLRHFEVEAARRSLGQAAGRVEVALQDQAAIDAAIAQEGSVHPAGYTAWLPSGLAERERAGMARRAAEAGLAEARAALAEARAAERALELIREANARSARRKASRREQAGLDEAAARIRAPTHEAIAGLPRGTRPPAAG